MWDKFSCINSSLSFAIIERWSMKTRFHGQNLAARWIRGSSVFRLEQKPWLQTTETLGNITKS
jgi:hypothetical protein